MILLEEEIVERTRDLLRAKLSDPVGDYELTCSPLLAQAVGDCAGVAFLFYAKHGSWEFATEDEHGHTFPSNDARHFIRRGKYDQRAPHVMKLGWAACLLRRCLAQWWMAYRQLQK